jgi:hypothetical protein
MAPLLATAGLEAVQRGGRANCTSARRTLANRHILAAAWLARCLAAGHPIACGVDAAFEYARDGRFFAIGLSPLNLIAARRLRGRIAIVDIAAVLANRDHGLASRGGYSTGTPVPPLRRVANDCPEERTCVLRRCAPTRIQDGNPAEHAAFG